MKPKLFFFIVLGSLVVIAGLGGAGYYYGLNYIHTQSNELAVQLAEQKAADAQIESLTKLEVKYQKEIVPIIPLVDGILPRNKKQSEILAQIERLAASNGLGFDGISIPPPGGLPSSVSQTINAGNVLAMPINFSVEGSYAKLETFTAQLENLNRFTNINSLAVLNQGATAKYTLSLIAYIKP
jgi:Tfp pilus assembly protein PilO